MKSGPLRFVGEEDAGWIYDGEDELIRRRNGYTVWAWNGTCYERETREPGGSRHAA